MKMNFNIEKSKIERNCKINVLKELEHRNFKGTLKSKLKGTLKPKFKSHFKIEN